MCVRVCVCVWVKSASVPDDEHRAAGMLPAQLHAQALCERQLLGQDRAGLWRHLPDDLRRRDAARRDHRRAQRRHDGRRAGVVHGLLERVGWGRRLCGQRRGGAGAPADQPLLWAKREGPGRGLVDLRRHLVLRGLRRTVLVVR